MPWTTNQFGDLFHDGVKVATMLWDSGKRWPNMLPVIGKWLTQQEALELGKRIVDAMNSLEQNNVHPY